MKRLPRPKPRQPDGMDIVGDYRKGVSSEEWAQIRDKWQREILRLKTDDEIREWFRVTWIVIGRLIGFILTYPSGTVIPTFYCGGVTLAEVRVTHPLAKVKAVEDSRVELSGSA
jgi:hypothetical protein